MRVSVTCVWECVRVGVRGYVRVREAAHHTTGERTGERQRSGETKRGREKQRKEKGTRERERWGRREGEGVGGGGKGEEGTGLVGSP